MPWSKDMIDVRYINLLNLASQLKVCTRITIA